MTLVDDVCAVDLLSGLSAPRGPLTADPLYLEAQSSGELECSWPACSEDGNKPGLSSSVGRRVSDDIAPPGIHPDQPLYTVCGYRYRGKPVVG